MMLPSPLPLHAALSPANPLPAEMPVGTELSAAFAALLGLKLQAGAADADVAQTLPDTAALAALPAVIETSDGKSLPGEVPVVVDAEMPGPNAESAVPALMPLAVAILPPQDIPPAVSSAAPPPCLPQHAGPIPQPVAQTIEHTPDQTPTPQPQPKAEQAPPAITLPRLIPMAAEDAPRPSPSASARLAPPFIEGTAPPAPAAPQLTLAAAEPSINSPTPSAPAPMRPQAPHEFATLVDRLIEARDTARAVQAPQTVSAMLAHADFGDVAIRFEHGAQALSVALSNPDPEFARAVQAAAPAPQTGDNGASPQRQDGSGQQATSAFGQSPQSGSQSSGQAQRTAGSAARNAEPHGSGHDQKQPGRPGIFA